MSLVLSWEQEFSNEIKNARSSREAGNEGRARVCARRAAGIAAGEYLSDIHPLYIKKSALENLLNLREHPDIPANLKDIVNLFLIHVDYDHNLPVDVDLIEKAIDLRYILFLNIKQSNE